MRIEKRAGTALLLACFLILTYFLFFSGTVVSGDERFIIDTIDSIATRGSLLLNQTVYERPLQTSDVEPAQPLVVAPLYWLAYQIPWVGNVHTIYLFSPIVTALTAVMLFYLALLLGYDDRVALIAAMGFGLTTFAWPYAKTLFREPFTMLLVVLVVYSIEQWRRLFTEQDKRHWLWFTAMLGVLVVALSSKEAVWMLLPTFALLALPSGFAIKVSQRQLIVVAVTAIVVVAGLAFFLTNLDNLLNTDTARYDLLEQAQKLPERIPESWGGFSGFLFSPGRSVWVYAPIVILSLASPWLLPLTRWRESWLMLATLVLYALVYAALRGPVWYGGVGWGPRYMLPILPLLIVATLPGIKALFRYNKWTQLALSLLLVIGFVIQFGGATVRLSDYYDYMQSQTGFAAWQGPGLWTFRWSQAIGSLLYIPLAQPDVVWMLPPNPDYMGIAMLLGGLVIIGSLLIWLQRTDSFDWRLIGIAPVLTVGVIVYGLARMYDDFRYNGHRQDLHEVRVLLEAEATEDNIIFLNSPSYVEFFMNYYKGESVWYSLPLSPGEQYSCEQPAEAATGLLSEKLHPTAHEMIASPVSGALKIQAPVYFLGDRAPFAPCATRPVEEYISRYLFPVSAADYEVDIRLVRFLPIFAPNRSGTIDKLNYSTRVDARFGNSILLERYRLAYYGTSPEEIGYLQHISPGDMLGVTLVWSAEAPIPADYTVGLFLIDENGQVVMQQDRTPVNGFAPTSSWDGFDRVGNSQRFVEYPKMSGRTYDNYGFILPEDMPSGSYDLVLVLYQWPSLERLPIQDNNGSLVGDQVTLTTINIAPRDHSNID